jgi:hypothetical protein
MEVSGQLICAATLWHFVISIQEVGNCQDFFCPFTPFRRRRRQEPFCTTIFIGACTKTYDVAQEWEKGFQTGAVERVLPSGKSSNDDMMALIIARINAQT